LAQTLGANGNELTITIPEAGETNWATSIRDNCFTPINTHDHTGGGSGAKIVGKDAIDHSAGIVNNNTYILGVDNAGTGTVSILRVTTSDTVEFGVAVSLAASSVLTLPQINDTSSDHQYIFAVNELAADRTVTLPLLTGNDEFVFKDHAVTLTNKTLTSPVLNTSISGTAFLDEDNMASDAADKVASQQSIKAYADTKLPEPAGNGIAVRTAADTAINRTIQATANETSVSNGDGVSGDPTIGLADNPVIPGTDSMVVPVGTTAQQVSTTAGAFRYNSTTSTFEGYSGGAWGAIGGGGVGSMTYIKTYKANDDGTTDWTVKSIDSLIPDFGATDTLTATFDASDTGEALFTNDDADAVYNITTAASSQYDAVGFNVNIPAYARGKDVGLSFFYRTEDTSGDSADGDYMVWVFDQTNGVETTFNDTPGTFTAGTSITVTSSTGMAVGDKIWIEEASQVVESHITAIADSTHVTLADDVTCGSADRFVTGVLTDILTTIDAADSDTNEIGEKFQVTFLPPETCTQVCVMIQQLTSETDSFLYWDGVVLDSSPFAKVSTQGETKEYRAQAWAGYASHSFYYTNVNKNTLSDYGTVTNDGTSGWTFTANRKLLVSASENFHSAVSGGVDHGFTVNGDITVLISDTSNLTKVRAFSGNSSITSEYGDTNSSATFIMEKGDVLATHGNSAVTPVSTPNNWITVTATPLTNESVIVESTDVVVGPWTSFTPSLLQLLRVLELYPVLPGTGEEWGILWKLEHPLYLEQLQRPPHNLTSLLGIL
jgi:hypothetical protein